MCLPDSDFKNFTLVKGRKVFVPAVLQAFRDLSPRLSADQIVADFQASVNATRDHVQRDRKREAAKLHKSQPVFTALRAQDDPERNETLVYRRTDQGRVIIGDVHTVNQPERKLVVPKYSSDVEFIIEAAA